MFFNFHLRARVRCLSAMGQRHATAMHFLQTFLEATAFSVVVHQADGRDGYKKVFQELSGGSAPEEPIRLLQGGLHYELLPPKMRALEKPERLRLSSKAPGAAKWPRTEL